MVLFCLTMLKKSRVRGGAGSILIEQWRTSSVWTNGKCVYLNRETYGHF